MWRPEAEKRWLAGVRVNEIAVAPLLRFLKTTEVGGRERWNGSGQMTEQAKTYSTRFRRVLSKGRC